MPNAKYMESKDISKDEAICQNIEKSCHIEIHKELQSIDPEIPFENSLARSVL
jgi:hypothetical protein